MFLALSVPGGSVSSSSTLHIFGGASPLLWLLCRPVRSLPLIPACPEQYTHKGFPRWVSPWYNRNGWHQLTYSVDHWHWHASLSFHWIPRFPSFVVVVSWICEDGDIYRLTVTSWGHPGLGMCDCFHLHCQAGGLDRLGCTVFVDGVLIFLDCEVTPSLVLGGWAVGVPTIWDSAVFCFLQ